MNKLILLLAGLLFASTAGAQVAVQNLPSGSAISGGDYAICDQSAVTNKCTYTQVAVFSTGYITSQANTWSATQTMNIGGNAATATNLASYPTLCSGGQFSEGLSSGSNNCATPSGSGTVTTTGSPASSYLSVFSGTTLITGTANATLSAGALTLGVSGTSGSVKMGNATSGTVTLAPVTGALGTVTASLPANTGTLSELNLAQTFTAAQTFDNSDLRLLGSSTGYNTFTAANSSSTDYTTTIPAATDTVAELTQTQTLTNKTISGASNTLSNISLASLASQAANTIVMNATGSSASPTAVAVASAVQADLAASTAFTVAGTGCTATIATGIGNGAGPFAGTIQLASGPCTAVTITINGATGFTAPNGYHCTANDKTLQAAGTWFGTWGESASTTTTVTIPIPGAAATTDVISVGCDYF